MRLSLALVAGALGLASLPVGAVACASLGGLTSDPSAEDSGLPERNGDAADDGGCVGAACAPPLSCDAGRVDCGGKCVDTASDALHCGACGRSCLGAACAAGRCASVAISTALNAPSAVRTVDPNVYVLQAGGILRLPKTAAGKAEPLFTAKLAVKQGPFALAVDANYAYFFAPFQTDNYVYRCQLGGCLAQPEHLVLQTITDPFAIEVDGTAIAWSGTYQEILRCTAANCTNPTTLVASQEGKQQFALLPTAVIWANEYNRAIYRCPRPSCTNPTEIVGGNALKGSPGPLVVHADKAYFATTGPFGSVDAVFACAVAGCGGVPEPIATAKAGRITALAVDASGVYWTVDGEGNTDGGVYGCKLGKACADKPDVVAEGRAHPKSVALDTTRVYWVETGVGPGKGGLLYAAK